MEQIGCLSFVALDGHAPPELELERLPGPDQVRTLFESAFTPFITAGAKMETVRHLDRPTSPTAGLHIIYVYGHAWLTPDGPVSAITFNGTNVLVNACELLTQLLTSEVAPRTILILDCCHAAAFGGLFGGAVPTPRLVVFACAADETAIALLADHATRLSLGLARKLARGRSPVDLVAIISGLRDELDRDRVIHGQHVSYRMNGDAVVLSRTGATGVRRRERTVARVRNTLLTVGGVTAVALIWAGWFYWSHVLITVDLVGLPGIASSVTLVVTEEAPATNGSEIVTQQSVPGGAVRFWSPAADLILRFQAVYRDGADRRIAFHLDLKPGFAIGSKNVHLALPPGSSVVAHPGMAYVPATAWYHGREREPQQNATPFWIDIRPPTVDEYRPIVEALLQSGQLKRDNSFLLTAEQRNSAVDAVGLGQLRSLNKDLGAIFGAVAQSTSPHVEAPGDIVVGLASLPCPTCPAVMTHLEAELYCSSQRKRLPTDLEWELAVRGVDGRVYPWGNEFDETRANVPGLPKKGEPPPALKPVEAYKNELSPFGLIDTVGNAGDWVTNVSGSYERVYMGATYQYNPEDATAFRMLPVTDSDYLVREITARCAVIAESDDKTAPSSSP